MPAAIRVKKLAQNRNLSFESGPGTRAGRGGAVHDTAPWESVGWQVRERAGRVYQPAPQRGLGKLPTASGAGRAGRAGPAPGLDRSARIGCSG